MSLYARIYSAYRKNDARVRRTLYCKQPSRAFLPPLSLTLSPCLLPLLFLSSEFWRAARRERSVTHGTSSRVAKWIFEKLIKKHPSAPWLSHSLGEPRSHPPDVASELARSSIRRAKARLSVVLSPRARAGVKSLSVSSEHARRVHVQSSLPILYMCVYVVEREMRHATAAVQRGRTLSRFRSCRFEARARTCDYVSRVSWILRFSISFSQACWYRQADSSTIFN